MGITDVIGGRGEAIERMVVYPAPTHVVGVHKVAWHDDGEAVLIA